MINEKFKELAETEDFLNLKDEYDQSVKEHDNLIGDIQKELDELKEEMKRNKQQEVLIQPPAGDKTSGILKRIQAIMEKLG